MREGHGYDDNDDASDDDHDHRSSDDDYDSRSDDDPPAGIDAGADAALQVDATGDGVQPDATPAGKHQKQVDDLVRPIMDGKWTVGLVVGLISADGHFIGVGHGRCGYTGI